MRSNGALTTSQLTLEKLFCFEEDQISFRKSSFPVPTNVNVIQASSEVVLRTLLKFTKLETYLKTQTVLIKIARRRRNKKPYNYW